MLTTTVDGLWVLQILSGIEALAPELGLRPTLPSLEARQTALAHPIADELRAAGAVDESGQVDDTVAEWLTVLARRDVALLIRLRTPDCDAGPSMALLARFDRWWVVLERSDEFVRIGGAGTATAETAAGALLYGQLERLCGTGRAQPVRPVTLDADALMAAVTDSATLRTFLAERRLDDEQVRALTAAADPVRSSQAAIVAIQSGAATGATARTHIEPGAVTVIATPDGRLVAEHVVSTGRTWLVVYSGTATNIAAAVNRMLRRLPADHGWHRYRKVV